MDRRKRRVRQTKREGLSFLARRDSAHCISMQQPERRSGWDDARTWHTDARTWPRPLFVLMCAENGPCHMPVMRGGARGLVRPEGKAARLIAVQHQVVQSRIKLHQPRHGASAGVVLPADNCGVDIRRADGWFGIGVVGKNAKTVAAGRGSDSDMPPGTQKAGAPPHAPADAHGRCAAPVPRRSRSRDWRDNPRRSPAAP